VAARDFSRPSSPVATARETGHMRLLSLAASAMITRSSNTSRVAVLVRATEPRMSVRGSSALKPPQLGEGFGTIARPTQPDQRTGSYRISAGVKGEMRAVHVRGKYNAVH